MLALADQTVSYATVGWACAHQHALAVHAVHALFLIAVVAGVVPAWQLRNATRSSRAGTETIARRHFLASLATASGVLSALVIVTMWMPTWFIAACFD